MKCVFIVFNQVLNEEVLKLLNKLHIRGFTQMDSLLGRGSNTGAPHMGSHSWPALNGGIISILPEEKALELLGKVEEMNASAEEQGIRAFMWNIEKTV